MQVTGICFIQADGFNIDSKDGQASIEFGGKERQAVFASGRLLGPAEKAAAAVVSATCAHTSQTDVDKINNAKQITITFVCDTGPRYVVRNAFLTKPCKLSGETGDLEVEFNGQPAQQT